jgi:hypothetical protein
MVRASHRGFMISQLCRKMINKRMALLWKLWNKINRAYWKSSKNTRMRRHHCQQTRNENSEQTRTPWSMAAIKHTLSDNSTGQSGTKKYAKSSNAKSPLRLFVIRKYEFTMRETNP